MPLAKALCPQARGRPRGPRASPGPVTACRKAPGPLRAARAASRDCWLSNFSKIYWLVNFRKSRDCLLSETMSCDCLLSRTSKVWMFYNRRGTRVAYPGATPNATLKATPESIDSANFHAGVMRGGRPGRGWWRSSHIDLGWLIMRQRCCCGYFDTIP